MFDNGDIHVEECTAGVLQGCTLGTFLYACGLSVVLRPLVETNPGASFYVFAGDTYIHAQPAAALKALQGLKRRSTQDIDITYNDKGVLWSPDGSFDFDEGGWRGAACDAAGAPYKTADPDVGLKVLGSWLGSVEGMERWGYSKLEQHELLITMIKMLRDAQCAFYLLRYCANTRIGYLLQTMPPCATESCAEEHMDRMREGLEGVLGQRVGERAWRQASAQSEPWGHGASSTECTGSSSIPRVHVHVHEGHEAESTHAGVHTGGRNRRATAHAASTRGCT